MIKNQNTKTETAGNTAEALQNVLQKACKRIAPVWPLENFVAVNPYLGLTELSFEEATKRLSKVGGVKTTMPLAYYLKAIKDGKLSANHIEHVLYRKGFSKNEAIEFISIIDVQDSKETDSYKVHSITDLVSHFDKKDWNRFCIDRITSWAAAYFDKGQALWKSPHQNKGIFEAWKAEAQLDRTPEIMGLKGFRKSVESLPKDPIEAAAHSLATLNIPYATAELYLHRLLIRVGGWAAYAAQIDWDKELYGKESNALQEFLCVLICWEACFYQSVKMEELQNYWENELQLLIANKETPLANDEYKRLILQEAYDLSAQQKLIKLFEDKKEENKNEKKSPKAQAIFCIDVRSEVYRRHLEQASAEIETLGFAGFFAFPIKYVPLAHEEGQAQCPVLLPTGPTVKEEIAIPQQNKWAIQNRQLKHQVNRSWKSFKLGAISCFSFVGPVGLAYLPKLFTDTFGITRPVPHPDRESIKSKYIKNKQISFSNTHQKKDGTGISLEEQLKLAKTALQAMSLTENFARLVLIVGHGSSTVNNPYATGLDCGACGGHTGEANARVAAAVLNNKEVRKLLLQEAIEIPEETIFLACQHDTTTDEVSIFNPYDVPGSHKQELKDLEKWLENAGKTARAERALRMQIENNEKIDKAIFSRSKDWSQVRPEWGLAGCSAFIVTSRNRTEGIDLEGKSFLHSYNWKQDKEFQVLELIMTAPMVVTSWISLQYYASTVDNLHYGSGNKALHNVTGGIGVLEGFAGDLRVGLPWQSVHDGDTYQHEPLKLNVVIEAPLDAMNHVLEKHENVRHLCENGWINLLAMNEEGKISDRYAGKNLWETINS
ncbi:DUF2309 domain-containing protein [Galbibacter sp. BG1]|uniref:YbcC family protein n=1 Tax=Galbibacter sp. BG1 TaxID=1170699 RepID=UPI0015B9778D|nr:DUF2309 domain-containing protein [Galbibacter sp. BG1]QLE01197.1 DUF2309 domain-containing protein [Galbibacter sp. BG1]